MDDNELTIYILQQLRQGVPEASIRAVLAQNGWPQPLVDRAFSMIQQARPHTVIPQPLSNEPSPQTTQPAAELPVPADNPYPALKDERSREAPSKRRQILVILLGLLALLVIGGMIYYFTTKEKPSREPAKVQIDDKRKEAVNRLASELLEYYKAKGTYPTLQEVNTPEFSKLPEGFNVDTYRDPSWNAQKSTCVTAQGKATLAEKRAGNCIAYRVTAPNGADCDAQQLKCTRAVLTATLEGDKPFIAALDRNKRE